jgi:hypothetical protein
MEGKEKIPFHTIFYIFPPPKKVPQGQVVELAIKSLELEQKSVSSSISGQINNLSIPLADRIPCFDYAAIYDGPKVFSSLF